MDIHINPNYGYMPQTMRKHVKAAYQYCKQNSITECKVNTMGIVFNFQECTGEVRHKENGETLRLRFTFTETEGEQEQ